MTNATLLGNGLVVTNFNGQNTPEPQIIPEGGVVWMQDRIEAVGPENELRRRFPDAQYLDANGGLITPGLINLHHHFYSALARGLDPRCSMNNFAEVLDRLWWRLDRALDYETVRISAELSVADCIRWGCTTVFDHHASPSCIEGSLEAIADVMTRAGLSGLLCYEITDRNGRDQSRAGLRENLDFIQRHRDHERIRGTVGLHASFTLSNETLAEIGASRPGRTGCHIHVAEDPVDIEASLASFGSRPLERLDGAGLLDELTLLAHGIHLEDEDYQLIGERNAVLIQNPESNANNGVGRLDVTRATGQGCSVGLGTDGMSSAVLRALRFAFLSLRDHKRDPAAGFQALPELLTTNVTTARRYFDEPFLGELVADAPADVISIDAPSPTPVSAENLFAHLVYGVSEAPVRHTVARGQILLRDFQHQTLDLPDLAERARSAAPSLWRRFHELDWGTPFLGHPRTKEIP